MFSVSALWAEKVYKKNVGHETSGPKHVIINVVEEVEEGWGVEVEKRVYLYKRIFNVT